MGMYPEFTSVQSSNILGVSYDAGQSELHVEFINGSRYKYRGVPEDVYEGLKTDPSPGGYLHDKVKGSYPYSIT